jgi:hypothetical protein
MEPYRFDATAGPIPEHNSRFVQVPLASREGGVRRCAFHRPPGGLIGRHEPAPLGDRRRARWRGLGGAGSVAAGVSVSELVGWLAGWHGGHGRPLQPHPMVWSNDLVFLFVSRRAVVA